MRTSILSLQELFVGFEAGSPCEGTTKARCKSAWEWLMKVKGAETPALAVTEADLMTLQTHLRDRAQSRYGKSFSVTTIFGYLAAIGQVFAYGVLAKLIERNPVAGLKRIKPTRKAVHVFTDDEIRDILDTVRGTPDGKIKPLHWDEPAAGMRWTGFILCGLHGLREGEIWPLRWDIDLDLDQGVLQIQSRGDKLGEWWQWNSKTKSERDVLMSDDLWAFFERFRIIASWRMPFLKERSYQSKCKRIGSLLEVERKYPYNNFHREFYQILRETNRRRIRRHKPPIEHGKFHTLRKNHATGMVEENVPLPYVQEGLGHASDRLTKEVYTYVNARKQQQVTREAMNRLLIRVGP